MGFYWRAIYKDGSQLSQIEKNEKGETVKENLYPDIDRSRLTEFHLIYSARDIPIVKIHLRPGQKLIARRRTWNDWHGNSTVVWLIGWHQTIKVGWWKKRNIQMLAFVFPDGHIEIVDRFYKDHPVFDPLEKMRPEEL